MDLLLLLLQHHSPIATRKMMARKLLIHALLVKREKSVTNQYKRRWVYFVGAAVGKSDTFAFVIWSIRVVKF
jgi:hypothetical protein